MRNSATIGQRRVIRHNTNTKRNFKHYRSRSNSSVVTFCDEESSQPTGSQGAKLVVDTLYTGDGAASPKSKSTLIGVSFQTTTFLWHACQPQPTPSMLPSMYNTCLLEEDGGCFALCKIFCRSLLLQYYTSVSPLLTLPPLLPVAVLWLSVLVLGIGLLSGRFGVSAVVVCQLVPYGLQESLMLLGVDSPFRSENERSVSPLHQNKTNLLGWVDVHDTLGSLVTEFIGQHLRNGTLVGT